MKYRGVYLKRGKWEARLGFRGKLLYIGVFGTCEDAAKARDEMALKLYGERYIPSLYPSKLELTVYRLCSSHFEGLSQQEAGKRVGLPTCRIQRILKRLNKRFPALFPIYFKKKFKTWVYNPGFDNKVIERF